MNLQVLAVPPSMPGAGPEVIASVVSYLVKPEAYFVTGMPPYVYQPLICFWAYRFRRDRPINRRKWRALYVIRRPKSCPMLSPLH